MSASRAVYASVAVSSHAVAGPVAVDSFYRPGLDILRVLAFFLIFLAHGLIGSIESATQTGAIARAGEFGVCVFFFLSSYLITELLIREKRDTGSILVPAFYARRILRIWPLYFAMIGVGWLYGQVSAPHTLSPRWLMSLLLLSSNWYTVHHGYPPGFLFPLWSIALEEQFYLAWPWLVRHLRSETLLGVAASFIGLAYVSMAILLGRGTSLDPGLWVNSLVQFQFFCLGAITAILLHGRAVRFSPPLRWALFAAGLVCMRGAQAAVFVNDPVRAHDFVHIAPCFLLALLGCLGLFFSLQQASSGRLQRPFIYLGKISYGLYVYHIVWLELAGHVLNRLSTAKRGSLGSDLAAMAIALPGTVATAMLSYRYLEGPFLRLKKRFTLVSSRPV
jgi:peptidoglycan/LPS O-acetylase OafA/YrhL